MDFKDLSEMSKQEAREEVEALREGIEHHNYLYYIENRPAISDAVYDRLFSRLQELEEAFPSLQSDNSPTRKIGAEPVDRLEKVDHTETMLSLNAVLEEEEIANFTRFIGRNIDGEKPEFVLEPKFDGLSVEIVYRNGEFVYGATRGDGYTGEDVSENIKTIGPVVLKLRGGGGHIPALIALRAEVIMRKGDFRELNKRRIERGEEPFANPRNAAAGIMRQLDPRKVADKPLDIFFYEILRLEGLEFSSHWEELEQFPRWGLKTYPDNRRCSSAEEMKEYREELESRRAELNYEIDGVVVKLNDLNLRNELGTRQRSPRWAIAWKFSPRKEVTTLEEIAVQVGRTGILTPVALLQPVDVGGVTVSRATLHNEEEVRKKDLRPGDTVRVIRAGDVIPEVGERIEKKGEKRGEEFTMPEKCPVCGTGVYKEGAYTVCPAGLSCAAQLKGHILHYASREAMNIEGLGEKIAEQLVERGFVRDVADLYLLSKDDLLTLEGFADKSAKNLYQAIQSTKQAGLSRFLYALGIRHVGQHVSRVLVEKFKSLDHLMEAGEEELRETREVGPEIAISVERFFDQDQNIQTIQRLRDAGVKIHKEEASKQETPLSGKAFVFTGELDSYTRSEAKRVVETKGGRATSSVSGETDFVVAGKGAGSKLEEAESRGVTIIDEDQFREMVEG